MANGFDSSKFDIQGLLGNPLFNIGVGLLSAGLSRPESFGQGLGQGLQFGMQQQGRALSNQFVRERLVQAQRQRAASTAFHEFVGRLGPQSGNVPGTSQLAGVAAVPGGASAAGTPATVPGVLSPVQVQALQQLEQTSPGKGIAGLLSLFPEPTTLARKINFVEQKLGRPLTETELFEMSGSGGTTVNVGTGDMNQPAKISDIARVVHPETGKPFPAGTTNQQLADAGAVPRTPAQQKEATAAKSSLTMLNDLDRIVRDNKIVTGFVDEGGIGELLVTPGGQVVSKIAQRLGFNVGVSEEVAKALTLQEGLSNSLLAAMRGASVGPEEQEKFNRQLPRLSQPPDVFKANVINTRRNIQALLGRSPSGGAAAGNTADRRFRWDPTTGSLVPK